MARDRGIEIASPRGAGEGGRGRRTLCLLEENRRKAGSASTWSCGGGRGGQLPFPARVHHQDMTMK